MKPESEGRQALIGRVLAYLREHGYTGHRTIAADLGEDVGEVRNLMRQVAYNGGDPVYTPRYPLGRDYQTPAPERRAVRHQRILDDWRHDLERTQGFKHGVPKGDFC